MNDKTVKFIDLFAGLGGIRLGFEQACKEKGLKSKCVLTSEIKNSAIKTYKHNFPNGIVEGDIYKIKNDDVPEFDFMLAGFPCQPFSSGGKRHGFADTRGTLFFEIERFLRAKKPEGFILENVEGLVKHDLQNKSDKLGNTLKTILYKLETELHYKVSWKVLDSSNFGVPQSRKRIYIVGTKNNFIDLENYIPRSENLEGILEHGLEVINSDFTKKLFHFFTKEQLLGKSIKDKRGGENNIHSWDLELKGECSIEQKILLNQIYKQRRRKQWAEEIGIDWMDGMPLTKKQISTFYSEDNLFETRNLQELLDDLVNKGYLRYEHPKKLIKIQTPNGEQSNRAYDDSKPKGYNIVTGKLSFEINKILNPKNVAPTLVATDMSKIVVPDENGLRRITKREGLRLFGFPEDYTIQVDEAKTFDLLGNSVVVPVIKAIAESILDVVSEKYIHTEQLKELIA